MKAEDLKNYLNILIELTETEQIKWKRRENSLPQIFDTVIDQNNTLTIHYDAMISRASLTIGHKETFIAITNLDVNGETYKSLSELWDAVAVSSLSGSISDWVKCLPKSNKKKKFGPQTS